MNTTVNVPSRFEELKQNLLAACVALRGGRRMPQYVPLLLELGEAAGMTFSEAQRTSAIAVEHERRSGPAQAKRLRRKPVGSVKP